ncbi:PorP/SprF family type IX secretion system membrane protein [Pedobacter hartonius]|uniref:Type IX secretion system membrane protein, PorP/SprF family n=1 Tax=Pedobacter hartonius TaxID=425514 RepID=A0A1H4ERD8_9SPHI|nr:PorP/SprF family type IX secretion system membrane protein [Pedobacter hartonius]SEA87188.1 type IX secretion system membrane protein, PorP/SprF family [Pedobacter hartonius]
MKKLIKIVSFGILCMLGATRVNAQIDPHFSQYYANPLWLNPGLTGVINGDYRVTINAKQQWSSISNSYLTAGASFDTAPTKNLSFGGMVLNQRAGAVSYNYLNALASAAYRVRFGQAGLNIVNFGIQAGILNKSFDPSKITTGSQFSGGEFDGMLPTNETFNSSNTLAPDVNFGVVYFDANDNKQVNIFAGAAANHLTRPIDRFLGNDVRIPIRSTFHGGARIKISDALDITPNGLYMRQGTARETSLGAYAQYFVNPETNLLFGSNYRKDDAAIAYFGMQLKNIAFGLSYDFNTSNLSRATGSRGGLEISVSFTSRKGIIGPNFFCPRL